MSSRILFAANLLIHQSMIPHDIFTISCNDKCILYMRFFENAYIACVGTSVPIQKASLVKNLRFKIILEIGIVFL